MRRHNPDQAAERIDGILDEAQERFASLGLRKVTMEDIADACGMAKASLYYYFPSKDDLFRGVVERELRQFTGELERIRAMRRSAARRIALCHRRRFALFTSLINLDAMNVQSWLVTKPVLRHLFEELFAAEHALLTDLIAEGCRNGEFDAASPARMATVLLHALQGLRIRATKSARLAASPSRKYEALEEDERDLVRTFIRGMQTRTAP